MHSRHSVTARKNWRQAQELMTLALAGSGTAVWDRNVITGEINYSPAWKAMLGYGSID